MSMFYEPSLASTEVEIAEETLPTDPYPLVMIGVLIAGMVLVWVLAGQKKSQ